MKISVTVVFLLFICIPFCNSQQIEGIVSYDNKPLKDVNILLRGTKTGTKTDTNGKFQINARKGDILVLSHITCNTVSKKVEDDKYLVINMVSKANILDEVLVKANDRRNSPNITKPKTFTGSFGQKTLESRGYSITYVEGKKLNLAAAIEKAGIPGYVNALRGKIANYNIGPDGVVLRSNNSLNLSNTALWDVDGVTYDGFPPAIETSLIKDIFVIRGLAGTTKYGTRGSGGVIVVTTVNNPAYLKKVRKKGKGKSKDDDLLSYSELKNREELQIPKDLEKFSKLVTSLGNDITALRVLAYRCQGQGQQLKAAQIYRKILTLAPNDGQSHRDLAQTWAIIRKPFKAWSAYLYWLSQNGGQLNNKLGTLVFNEMEKLFVSEDLDGEVSQSFEIQNIFDSSEVDTTRIVFEWASINKEFTLEISNSEGQTFNVDYGKAYNTSESFDEFYLDQTIKGNWKFNITPNISTKEPLNLKVSIYPKWNSTNKTFCKIKVYTFFQNDISQYNLFKIKV
ncbi:carboxypeptidase-like regulatory domain-containing protein [Maribacter sp. IgM3_T14_3]|uniref:tetratricopeptide repeat protein n=1 Tax=Maribacter sp. IgM3_T14_3 TaxID=3415140 RepID=UPI003C7035F8